MANSGSEARAVGESGEIVRAVAFGADGLVPVVAQDEVSGEVLMLAYANEKALHLTLATGRAHYYSRSRRSLWRKGDTSGNVQTVSRVSVDCDGDALLYIVRQEGPACHTGERSCFFRASAVGGENTAVHGEGAALGGESVASEAPPLQTASDVTSAEGGAATQFEADGASTVEQTELGRALALLDRVVAERLAELPDGSYVTRLHERGLGYMAQKVVEEAGETVVAALERREGELLEEAADLLFHLAVLLRESGQSLLPVAAVLELRHRERTGERGSG